MTANTKIVPSGRSSEVLDGAVGFGIDGSYAAVPAPLERADRGGGIWTLSVTAPDSQWTGLILPCEIDEHFVGLGQQFTQLDKRGRIYENSVGRSTQSMVELSAGIDGSNIVAPIFYSSAGYAAIVETAGPCRIEFAVRDPHQVVIRAPGESITLTFIRAAPLEALQQLMKLKGCPPLAAPWAYGVWHGMRGGDEAVRAEAKRMRNEHLGCSAVWLDAHYEPATNSGFPAAGTYPLGEYPDIAKTVAAIHELGLKALTYVNPFLYKGTPAYETGVRLGHAVKAADGSAYHVTNLHPFEGDVLPGLAEQTGIHIMADGSVLLDFTSDDAVAWWQGLLRKILLEEGFDGWMQDFGEQVLPDMVFADGSTGITMHNLYPTLYHAASADEVRRTKPDAIFFARAGYLGSQVHAPVFWPADQTRDWSPEAGMGGLVAAGISIGLMGVAAWGSDIGGNMGGPFIEGGFAGGSQDKELWIRWCQLGAMSPVMRDHLAFHRGIPVDLWTDDETISTWRETAAWHLRLFPYLYSLAHEATDTGVPIMRGLMLHYPADPESWALSTQYMLGDALIAAPVLEKGARMRRVYLPEPGYVNCWTDEQLPAGWVDVDAPLDRWPVFQRPGTIVPMLLTAPLDLNSADYAAGIFDLELRMAPGVSATGRLFDGTLFTLDSAGLQVQGSRHRRYRLATPSGQMIDEAEGSSVTLAGVR
ncbi:MAG: TIM-barrel domain-containing protein [Candidatus Dormibacteria bacterium]